MKVELKLENTVSREGKDVSIKFVLDDETVNIEVGYYDAVLSKNEFDKIISIYNKLDNRAVGCVSPKENER